MTGWQILSAIAIMVGVMGVLLSLLFIWGLCREAKREDEYWDVL